MVENEVSAAGPLAQLRVALAKGKLKRVRRILRAVHPAKAAHVLESLSAEERASVWQVIDSKLEEPVLKHLSPMVRSELARESDVDADAVVEAGETQLERLLTAIESGRPKRIVKILSGTHPAKVAGLLESLPLAERRAAWDLLDIKRAAKVLRHLHTEARTRLALETDVDELGVIAAAMALDDLVDLLQDLPEEAAHQLMQALDVQKRKSLQTMLAYPEDTAGGLMNADHITVRADVRLSTVLRYLRARGELPENTDTLMVVDRKKRYAGVLAIPKLVTGAPERLVEEEMNPDQIPIPVGADIDEVAQRFEDEDLLSAPVVNEKNVVVGRITVDDVVNIIRDESDHSMMKLAGMDEQEDMFAPVMVGTRRRAVWLGINLLTAFLAAWVIGLFEGTLEQIVALAVLMPIVASMGGIAGTQTLTLMIRGLALGQVEGSNAGPLLAKEITIGLLNGVLWAVVVAVLAVVWFKSVGIGVIIAAAILLNLLGAALAGFTIPLIMRRFGIDPALAGGVVLTTVTDVVGFLSFLGLATMFLL